ncbi:hypothetical protein ACPOL_6537 [Acidisarcina polymorpha]|uniref:Uncharacterized protein n=1 Tax=Acidisarcina polymorpha TaxID=2211140 RepID=A0A2Z5GA71_9BACT|nr:hypothetical protein ACPOL_6537 [Acidisarcina polymorpha]
MDVDFAVLHKIYGAPSESEALLASPVHWLRNEDGHWKPRSEARKYIIRGTPELALPSP